MHFTLNSGNSVANHFLSELRDVAIQQDRMRFRKNVERLGEIMAYELSKKLTYKSSAVTTPLGGAHIPVISDQPVLITILRAGLPYFQGFLNYFDRADCGFIGAYRVEQEDAVTIRLNYLATTDLSNRCLVLIDPMLATGRSIVDSLDALKKYGTPSELHIVSLIAAPEGLKFLSEKLQVPHHTWTCAIDERLNDDFYIVPGLGDAGDLSFGVKI
jgi:uracil phosphoribosyltransferase